ncbi:AAA family ATPase, partial [Candidatus Woesearchaeota archaeon]|nr:AAA family ATPase [Candidatus Woesearchaeota archaeon]
HDSSFAAQLANARSKVAGCQEKLSQAQAKTASFRAGVAANHAVKSILSLNKKGVYGTVAELGQVKKKYALALERSAGQKMQHLVVDNDRTASECIAHLQKNRLGHAAFIPLNKIKYQDISAEDQKLLKAESGKGSDSGVHDFALRLVSFDVQFKPVFAHVFGNTLVVENLDVARRIGIGRVKMAALDGAIAEGSGVMRGGYFSDKNMLGFKEQDVLEELEKGSQELEELQKVVGSVQMKREANEQEISGLRKKRAELEAEVITLEKTLHLDTADLDASEDTRKQSQQQLKNAEEKLLQLGKEITAANKDLAEAKSRKQILRAEITTLRDPRLLAQLQAFEASRQKTREELLRLESDLKNMNSNVQQMLAPEQEKVKEIMKQHEKEESLFKQELKTLTEEITVKEGELINKEKESSQFYARYRELFNQREKLSTEITKAENEVEQAREKARTHERELNLTSLKNAEVKAKLAGLQEEFARYPGVQLLEGKSPSQLEEEIRKLETVLTQMSAVNLRALEIYEEIEKEYGKLVEKKDELDKEKIEIMSMMNEIETKKKDHFMKTFDLVHENFQRIFGNLFSKGKASLVLENPQEPFADGLSIKVKLTGNRYMDIKSLSGGEKTLTALAFIFSIQEHQPASFYILDEIDAALDKHNSDRLSKLVRSYSDGAQYILISHNDSVIAEADTLFGVSMLDGVSKVTSLRI